MKLNPDVAKRLKQANIPVQEGFIYLLAVYFNLDSAIFSNTLKLKINSSGIIGLDPYKTIQWNIPLFEGAEVAFGWVKTEYVPLFKAKNPDKGGKVREATRLMKKFFAENPDIRKDEVLGATQMYLSHEEFIRFPHYFIEKGRGANKIQDLLDWVEKYREAQQEVTRTSISDKMQ